MKPQTKKEAERQRLVKDLVRALEQQRETLKSLVLYQQKHIELALAMIKALAGKMEE